MLAQARKGQREWLGLCVLLNIKGEKGEQGHICAVPNENDA